jgi:hypothetical protein
VSAIIGGAIPSFLGMTVVLFGAAAAMTGQALARNWRPQWQLLPYALLLAACDRFLLYALFEAELLSAGGFAVAAVFLYGTALVAYWRTRTRRLRSQYPWLYQGGDC